MFRCLSCTVIVGLVLTTGDGLTSAIGVRTAVAGKTRVKSKKKIPVIYDSDIGDDIDDTWALCLLLKSPELDLKLVVGDQGRVTYRTKLFAKLLQTAGRTDVPIGRGLEVHRTGAGRQRDWVADYDLKSYPGKIYEDGVQAIIDTIMKSPEPITVIAVGPLPNIREALRREPRIAEKARFVGMHGSVRKGYGGSPKIAAEYNVRADVKACQAALSAAWDITITPVDTCGLVALRGKKYAAVRTCRDPLTRALIENYRLWWKNRPRGQGNPKRAETVSSTLFDTVAVYLAFSQKLCKMETLPIRVTDEGKTVIDPSGKRMRVATEWKNLGRFEDFLVERLTGKLKVMLVDGQNNHQWQKTTPVLKRFLERTGRFTVTIVTSPPKGSPRSVWTGFRPRFADYDVVLSNYNGELWPEPVQRSLEKYVSGGGGLVIVHAANNAFPQWSEWNKMIGLGWRGNGFGDRLTVNDSGRVVRTPKGKGPGAGHGPQHPFQIVVRDTAHPVMKGMPSRWMHVKDELYQGQRGPALHMHILATAYADRKYRGSGTNEPMIWWIPYGRGKVFTTVMGHADYTMRGIGFQTVVARGCEWVATGKVTLPIPRNFPTAEKTSSVGD